jgi:hypothetical protein
MAAQTVLSAKKASGEAKVKAGGSVRTLEEQKQIRARRRAKELEMVKDDFTGWATSWARSWTTRMLQRWKSKTALGLHDEQRDWKWSKV